MCRKKHACSLAALELPSLGWLVCAVVRRLSPPLPSSSRLHRRNLLQFGWGRAAELCGAGVCCGAAAFAAAAKLERGYACAEIMHAVWLGSSQAEPVRSWCVAVRRLSPPPPSSSEARYVQKLWMQFGCGRVKPSLCGAGRAEAAAAAAAAKLERGCAAQKLCMQFG